MWATKGEPCQAEATKGKAKEAGNARARLGDGCWGVLAWEGGRGRAALIKHLQSQMESLACVLRAGSHGGVQSREGRSAREAF